MTTFRKVWALTADHELTVGTTTLVHLKSGDTKEVLVGNLIDTTKNGKFVYSVGHDDDE